MTFKQRLLSLLPPLLVGFVAAVTLEASAGVLLFADEGLFPALTLLLTVEVGALGLGLWSGSLSMGVNEVEQIRRRWLFSLVSFALAAALAAGLSFMGDLPGSMVGQGVGLGFLGGLPLFSLGSLLGALSRSDEFGKPLLPRVGAPSVLGAALGFLLAGSVLIPNAAPYTLFLSCLVILSGGALLQGWVLDERPSVEVLERVPTATGEIRVEGRAVGNPRRELTVLLEGGRLRGAEDQEGNPGRAWEAAVLEVLGRERLRPGSVLYLGGGSGTFARFFSQRFPQVRIHIVERSQELVTLARSHFAKWDGWEGVGLHIREPLASIKPLGLRPFSMIVVDCGALPSLGRAPFLGDSGWHILLEGLEAGGVVLMGGLRGSGNDSTVFSWEVFRSGRQWFEEVSLYQAEAVPATDLLMEEAGEGLESFLLFSTTGAAAWPLALSGFQLRPAEES